MPREFSIAPPGIPDGVRPYQGRFGDRLGAGFFYLNGGEGIGKRGRRYWWPAEPVSAGTARGQTRGEALRWRAHRLAGDFARGCPRVSLEAFLPPAWAAGARSYLPGDRLAAGAVRFAVVGRAVMGRHDVVWDLGLWAGDYRTDLGPACAAAAAAVMRWWRPRTEKIIFGNSRSPWAHSIDFPVDGAHASVLQWRLGEERGWSNADF